MVRGHAEALMPLLARVMDESGMAFADLDRIVVTTGPGSFTGLRVGISAARGYCARDRQAGRRRLDALGLCGALSRRRRQASGRSPPSMRGMRTFICRFSLPAAASSSHRGWRHCSEAVRAAAEAPARIVGSAAQAVAARARQCRRSADHRRRARRARHRLGRAHGRAAAGSAIAAQAAISARPRRAAAKRRATAAPMMNFLSRLFGRGEPAFSEARPRDAAAIAALHGASFQRGWGEDEVHRLLIEQTVVAHRAMRRPDLDRLHPVAPGRRRSGNPLGRDRAGIGAAAAWRDRCSICICAAWPGLAPGRCFSKSTKTMPPACRLYRRAGFYEVGRRQGYYQSGATALVLRRDLG